MRRCAPCTLANPAMPDILQLANVTAGYGPTVIVEDVSSLAAARSGACGAWTQWRGQDHVDADDRGTCEPASRAHPARGQDVGAARPWLRARLGMGYVPQERDIFPSLTVLENLSVGSRAGDWTLDRIFELFPSLADGVATLATSCPAASSRC